MSKFSRGDIVDVAWFNETTTRGIVHEAWSWSSIVHDAEKPKVGIFLFEEGFIGHFYEDEVELAMDEYEFAAVAVDNEDFEQVHIGVDEWGTLEEAERLIERALVDSDDFYRENKQLQINRRRKAGHTVGYKAYRW